MSIHRKLMAGCAVVVLTSGLAACGSSGSSDNSALDSLQETLDALQTAYGADDLTPDAIDQLQTDLAAKIAEIGTADDADSLMGMLAARVAEIGSEADGTGLMGKLATKTAEVVDLMTTLGDETNPDAASVRGMLAARIAEIGSAADGTGLMGELAAKIAEIGSAADGTGLMGELAAKIAEIGSEADGTGLLGMLAAERKTVSDLRDRIAALEGGTDPVLLTPIQTAAKDASDAAATAETAGGCRRRRGRKGCGYLRRRDHESG